MNFYKYKKRYSIADTSAKWLNPTVRYKWQGKSQFFLSCIGMIVGVGNVWRFPYYANKYGGGSFMLAHFVMICLAGYPMVYMEMSLGQFAGVSTLHVWRCFPLAKGLGVAMVMTGFIIGSYYSVLMCYGLFYVGMSFKKPLPWDDCYPWWNPTSDCYSLKENATSCRVYKNTMLDYELFKDFGIGNDSDYNPLLPVSSRGSNTFPPNCRNGSQSSAEQFWHLRVLGLTDGIEHLGTLQWDLVLTLFVCYLLIFLCLIKGLQTSGKIVYLTATFPYAVLILLAAYACTLSKATTGLYYLFMPKWDTLMQIDVWRAAAEQVFLSLSVGWGGLIMYSSYNKFDDSVFGTAITLCILDFITSILSGTVVFAVIGHIAAKMQLDMNSVVQHGPGLAFIVYPETVAKLPVPQIWSFLFFFMFFLIAIDNVFAYLQNFFAVVTDQFPEWNERQTLLTIILCSVCFLFSLIFVTQGGYYFLILADKFVGGYCVLFLSTCEIIVVMWCYGADRFLGDLEFMLNSQINKFWMICWKYVTPLLLLCTTILGFANHSRTSFDLVDYPKWTDYLGWSTFSIIAIQIPLWAIIISYRYKESCRLLLQPHEEWGPSDTETNRLYRRVRYKKSIIEQADPTKRMSMAPTCPSP